MSRFSWRRFLCFFVCGLAVAYLGLLGSGSYLYTYALLHPGCSPEGVVPSDFQPLQLVTAEGLELQGWWKPPANGAVILLVAGLGGSRAAMLPEAEMLAHHGYGVVTLDSRSCAGWASTLGQRETSEFNTMLDYALAQPGVDWVGALGFSIGGVAVLNGAAARPEVQAVIAQGNYANLYGEIMAVEEPAYHPQRHVQQSVALFYTLMTGIWPGNVSPLEALPKINPRPVLLVHGEYEVERTHAREQVTAGGSNVQLWIVPGAGHGEYREAGLQEYEERIVEFFDAARLQKDSKNRQP